ncbi:MAG: DUF599 domain-containing protein [Candidatus Puniceispirillum sp.]|nr:DUF599 domain-containing protein [Candidatus Puniceispirillum sp.]
MSLTYVLDILRRYMEEAPLEFIAFVWFLMCWLGYNYIVDNFMRGARGLSARMHLYRVQWMNVALRRDNRVLDINILSMLQSSIAFFASTSILILAGLLALLGATPQVFAILKQIPFADVPAKVIWYSKVFLLCFLYIYIFFKMTWSLRQLNYASVLLGAMPLPHEHQSEHYLPTARRAAMINTMAARDMNRGLRAYYFSIAALSWFVSPVLFMVSTAFIMLILYRREFESQIVHILSSQGKNAGTDKTE